MRINNVMSGYGDAALRGKKGEAVGGNAGPGMLATEAGAAAAHGNAFCKVLDEYDVTSITPAEFSEMLQKMHQTGAIGDAEMQELSTVRADLDAAGVGADDRIDLTAFYAKRLNDAQQQLANASESQKSAALQPLKQKLDWMQKFALVHANPDALGLNALA